MQQKINLDLRQKQTLILTPELRQSIELLNLNIIDLAAFAYDQVQANPVLGIKQTQQESLEDEAELRLNRQELEDRINGYDFSGYAKPQTYYGEERPSAIDFMSTETDLIENLRFQFSCIGQAWELDLAEILFAYMDANGYISRPLEEIAGDTGKDLEDLKAVKVKINKLDPPGVGALSLEECLLLQCQGDEVCEAMIRENLEDIAANRMEKIAQDRGISLEEATARVAQIKALNPKPGASYADNQPVSYVYPEAYIYKEEGTYSFYMDKEFFPDLYISDTYRAMVKEADGETLEYLNDKIDSAQWLIEGIRQREVNMKKVLAYLVDYQKDFLDQGKKKLRPLSQKDLAQELDISESTVSRIVNDKYVACPQGTIEIKDFFASAPRQGQEGLSSTSIQALIKDIIDREDKKKPLSDSKIEKELKGRGVDISRRTVAKYRDQLGIGKASLRRQY